MDSKKQLYIIGGCNGAGKTTASYTVLPDVLECKEFVNADEIARGLSPFNPESMAIEAGRLMLQRIDELLKSRQNFSIETTLATRSYTRLVRRAQEQGYKVNLIYFWLSSPDLAIQRVAQRVRNGGHNIPKEVVIRRYQAGKQEEFPKNLHDLYLIDYRNLSCQKLTEFPAEGPIVYSNSMVIDSLNNNFYTLKFFNDRFHSSLSLFSVDLRNFERKSFADSIPYNFLDSESFCDIFLDKLTNDLYSILLQEKESGFYSVDVYSLSYPPLNWTDILQDKYLDNEVDSKRIVYLLLAGIGVSLILLLYFFFRPKKKVSNITTSNFSDKDTIGLINRKQFSAIYLLGGLQIFDSNGNDITQKFTPVIRQMFLFILLNFIQNGKGITSERLDETFWSGMDKDSASNNRNVNIRKLRLLLKEIGDITLKNEKSYWLLDIGSEVFIDYAMIISLLLEDKLSSNFDSRRLAKILELASQGILLPNMITDWIDHYKSDYSGKIINFLLEKSKTVEVQRDLVSMQKIADIVLLHDDIDEEAIRLKCIALYKLGQKGLSKSRFEKFRSPENISLRCAKSPV